MSKDSTKKALFKYLNKREQRSSTGPKRKLKQPEKCTEKEVLAWCVDKGFHVHVVESSTYDYQTGRASRRVTAKAGFPDLVGNTSEGHSVWIELKAKSRISTLRPKQKIFLETKIRQNCFAVCVDSAVRLDRYWKQYSSLNTPDLRQSFLIDCLPKKVPKRSKNYDPDMGF